MGYQNLDAGSAWATFDTTTINTGASAFYGGVFDGRYLYLVPAAFGRSIVARYDTEAAFDAGSAWATFDTTTINAAARGFMGGVFDGRYVYLVPNWSSTAGANGVVARYDTEAAFDAGSAWATVDTATINAEAVGFAGGVFDGRYIYLVPGHYGVVARYDTEAAFDAGAAWATFNATTLNPAAVGFAGGVFDGRYLYLVPSYSGSSWDGVVARYDTEAAFDAGAAWETFDTATINAEAVGFAGGVFDGRYVYLVPSENGGAYDGIVARYDTEAAFDAGAAWETFDTTTINAEAVGFAGGVFDGRYLYLVPSYSGSSWDGVVARYDTEAAFDAGSAWETFDTTTINSEAAGFLGGVFDGRYVYLVPCTGNGRVTRFDARGMACGMPDLPGFFPWGPGSFY